jgi:anti-sigma regulatory factor (Ser/Thr protein kinase)
VRSARRWVRDVLARWGCEGPAADLVELLTSELATNAVVHAGTPYRVVVRRQHDLVRVSVEDGTTELPVSGEPHIFGPSGRGLQMMSHLANAWGVEADGAGKVVWFEVEWVAASHWLNC